MGASLIALAKSIYYETSFEPYVSKFITPKKEKL